MENYHLFSGLISKPWCHISNVGCALILVNIYMKILKYRKIEELELKKETYPYIHRLHVDGIFGWLLPGVGLAVIAANLLGPHYWAVEAMNETKLNNALYYGISRTSWVFSVFLICIGIFAQRFNMGRAVLSGNNMRILAKAMPIMAVI